MLVGRGPAADMFRRVPCGSSSQQGHIFSQAKLPSFSEKNKTSELRAVQTAETAAAIELRASIHRQAEIKFPISVSISLSRACSERRVHRPEIESLDGARSIPGYSTRFQLPVAKAGSSRLQLQQGEE